MRKKREALVHIVEDINEEFPDIVDSVIKSLLTSHIDYCYSKESAEKIKNIAQEKGISCCFIEVKDEDGNFDYVQFIPVKYYEKSSGFSMIVEKTLVCDIYQIPKHYQCKANLGGKNRILKNYGEIYKYKEVIE